MPKVKEYLKTVSVLKRPFDYIGLCHHYIITWLLILDLLVFLHATLKAGPGERGCNVQCTHILLECVWTTNLFPVLRGCLNSVGINKRPSGIEVVNISTIKYRVQNELQFHGHTSGPSQLSALHQIACLGWKWWKVLFLTTLVHKKLGYC